MGAKSHWNKRRKESLLVIISQTVRGARLLHFASRLHVFHAHCNNTNFNKLKNYTCNTHFSPPGSQFYTKMSCPHSWLNRMKLWAMHSTGVNSCQYEFFWWYEVNKESPKSETGVRKWPWYREKKSLVSFLVRVNCSDRGLSLSVKHHSSVYCWQGLS